MRVLETQVGVVQVNAPCPHGIKLQEIYWFDDWKRESNEQGKQEGREEEANTDVGEDPVRRQRDMLRLHHLSGTLGTSGV